MPAASQSRDELLASLLDLFRRNGYDGTSIADIGAATGLGKSSLYHHFPGGKEEMALAVLAYLDRLLTPAIEAAHAPGPPAERLAALLGAIDAFYDGGRAACLLERLGASVHHARFADPLRAAFGRLQGAFEAIAREAGAPDPAAFAEDALVRIEGALVVAAGNGDPGVFSRAIGRLRLS